MRYGKIICKSVLIMAMFSPCYVFADIWDNMIKLGLIENDVPRPGLTYVDDLGGGNNYITGGDATVIPSYGSDGCYNGNESSQIRISGKNRSKYTIHHELFHAYANYKYPYWTLFSNNEAHTEGFAIFMTYIYMKEKGFLDKRNPWGDYIRKTGISQQYQNYLKTFIEQYGDNPQKIKEQIDKEEKRYRAEKKDICITITNPRRDDIIINIGEMLPSPDSREEKDTKTTSPVTLDKIEIVR